METWTVTKRLGRTVDGRLVDYYDPEAAFLAYRPGDRIPLSVAIAASLIDAIDEEEVPDEPTEQEILETDDDEDMWPLADEAQTKQEDAPENKMARAPENKGFSAPPEVRRARPRKR
jgi:hypothetical protein